MSARGSGPSAPATIDVVTTSSEAAREAGTASRAAVSLRAHRAGGCQDLPTRAWLGKDVVAGITSWAVMVPVALAYAELAGVPASVGLITATAGLTAYAILGTSRHAKVTTSSTMAVMSASVVAPAAGGDAATYLAMTAMLAILVGVMLLVAGVLRLGFLAEFLAKPVITGFIVGLALTIAVGQLPKLFGVDGQRWQLLRPARPLRQPVAGDVRSRVSSSVVVGHAADHRPSSHRSAHPRTAHRRRRSHAALSGSRSSRARAWRSSARSS